MRVKDCNNCEHCQRRTWTHTHKPKGYHTIGMTHAFAYCKKHKRRVSEVKKCDERRNEDAE